MKDTTTEIPTASQGNKRAYRDDRGVSNPLTFAAPQREMVTFPLASQSFHVPYNELLVSSRSTDFSVPADDHRVLQTSRVFTTKRDGQRLINDYAVLEELGRGSYGKVTLVRHSATQKLFAMKSLQGCHGNARKLKQRMQAMRREVAVMKRICHPHMVRLHEVLHDPKKDRLYVVMQYIKGGSIAKKVTDWTIQPQPESQLRVQARQLLSALKYMQLHSVVHRDIKPENILVDEECNVYLADFGMSAVCTEEDVAVIEGTPAFTPPEVCRAEAAVSSALVDVWALGVSLYQLMYGVLPFTAFTQLELVQVILEAPLRFPDEDPDWPAASGPPVSSPEFKELIRGMLEKDPRERWDVQKAITSRWLESCRCVDSPPELPLSGGNGGALRDFATINSSCFNEDIADRELEEAIASCSTSGVEF